MLRKNEKPLQQIVNRQYEKYEQCILQLKDNDALQLKVKEPNCFVLTYNGTIVKITNFCQIMKCLLAMPSQVKKICLLNH